MADRTGSVVLEHDVRIPLALGSVADFRAWAQSPGFPERGRVDYLGGDIEVDMSPEDLYTHGTVKAAIAAALHHLVVEVGQGEVFIDRTRVSHAEAGLSVEPDVVVAREASLESGRLREVPGAAALPNRFVELEGAPDLVVEIVSDGSEEKDRRRLPALYARAGVLELWLVDARGTDVALEVHVLAASQYRREPCSPQGWVASPVLGARVRLGRTTTARGRWRYRLECVPATA